MGSGCEIELLSGILSLNNPGRFSSQVIFQRAFKVAGASGKTAEGSTRLAKGANGKRAAFLKAQKELKAKYPNPYYWGAFVMVVE
jgi:hypothetical protein